MYIAPLVSLLRSLDWFVIAVAINILLLRSHAFRYASALAEPTQRISTHKLVVNALQTFAQMQHRIAFARK